MQNMMDRFAKKDNTGKILFRPVLKRPQEAEAQPEEDSFDEEVKRQQALEKKRQREEEHSVSILDEQEKEGIKLVYPDLYHTLQKKHCDPEDQKRAVHIKKKRGKLIVKSMIRFLRWISLCKYQLKEVAAAQQIVGRKPLVRDQPFARPFAKDFLWACKYGDHDAVERLLEKDPFLVHEYDDIRMTGFHWACKKSHLRIAEHLLENHADPKAEDILKRTPEFFAAKANNSYTLNLIYKRTHLSKFSRVKQKAQPKEEAPDPVSPQVDEPLRGAGRGGL